MLHNIGFVYEVNDTPMGPRILRTLQVSQKFGEYRERNRDTWLEGSDFYDTRYLIESDLTADRIRAHVFSCLKEVLNHEYKGRV